MKLGEFLAHAESIFAAAPVRRLRVQPQVLECVFRVNVTGDFAKA